MRNTNSIRAQQTRSADGYAEPAGVGRAVYRSLLVFCALVFLWGMLHPIKAQAASKSKYKVSFGRKTLFVGEKQQIAATGKKVTYKYKSSNKSVLSVNKKGVLKAKKKGTAKITVTAYWKVKGKTRYKAKNYTVKVRKLKLKKKSVELKSGDITTVKFNQNIGSRTLTFTSSNSRIAVEENGYIKALKPGSVNLSIKVGSDLTYTFKVKVTVKELSSASYKLLFNQGSKYQTANYTTLDLKTLMMQEKKIKGVLPVYYEVKYPMIGSVTDGVYKVLTPNNTPNQVDVYAGGYKKTFYITGYRWGAHRGYYDVRPENTIDAFEAAGMNGAAMCETDLQLTKDRKLVCHHDAKVDDMTDGTGYIRDKTYDELKELHIDVGNGKDAENLIYERKHDPIPEFATYLDIMKEHHMIAIIELKEWKGHSDEAKQEGMKKVYDIIKSKGMQNQCMLISFYADQFKLFYEVNGDTGIPFGALDTTSAPNKCLNEAKAMNLPNLSDRQATKFGAYFSHGYSPLLGRQNMPWRSYHACRSNS